MRNTPLSGLLSAIVILSSVSCANTTTTSSLPEHKVGIVAHRGFWNCEEAGYAQNSVAALRQAQLAGFWGSEFERWSRFRGRYSPAPHKIRHA